MAASPIQSDFFFTGGTALSVCYLQHRYSDDLDFFTEDPQAVRRVPAELQRVADELGIRVSFTRTMDHFMECFLLSPTGERLEMDFALFPLSELLPKAKQKHVGLDNYWLAQAFTRAADLKLLPRLIKPVTCERLAAFFTQQIPWLMRFPLSE